MVQLQRTAFEDGFLNQFVELVLVTYENILPCHTIKKSKFELPLTRSKKKRIREEQNGMMRSMQQKVSFFGKGKKKVKKWCLASVNRILLKIFNLSNIKQIMHYINTQLLHQLLVYRSEQVKECSLATDSKERYWVRRG